MLRTLRVLATLVFVGVVLSVLSPRTLAQPATGQRVFDSPDAAAKALVAAVRANDDRTLTEIFGPRHADLISTGDRRAWADFLKAVDEYRLLRLEGDGRVRLVVGYDAWPMPIPLLKDGAGWRFDTDAGRQELLDRRIGRNELAVIDALHAYVAAQRQYASMPRDGSAVRQFARKVRSSPGKRDGLYWDSDPAKPDDASPFGPLIAESPGRRASDPYYGYHFKILTRQGPAASAGRYDYIINGRLIGGFAMVAYPAQHGLTGFNTFIVNHYGVVYEQDLGSKTAGITSAMTEYNPDRSWRPVRDK